MILKSLFIIILIIFPIAEVGRISFGSLSFSINDIFVVIFSTPVFLVGYKNLKKKELFKPILLFIVISIISLLINISNFGLSKILFSSLYLIRWISYSSIYFWLVGQEKSFILKIKNFLIFPISIVLFFGAVQFIFYQNLRNLYYLGWDEHLYRLFSSFLDPNFAAVFLSISFIFLIDFAQNFYKSRKYFIFTCISILSLINIVEVFLTYSRSGLIMLSLSLFAYLVMSGRKRIILLAGAFFLILLIISPRSFNTEGTNIFRIASAEARLQSAQVAIQIIQKNPIFGVGFNTYRYAQNKYGFLEGPNWESTHSGAGTDNSYLFILATTGIIGLISYIFLIYKILFLAKENINRNKFAMVFISIFIGVLINSFFVNSLFYVYVMEIIWIFAAITQKS